MPHATHGVRGGFSSVTKGVEKYLNNYFTIQNSICNCYAIILLVN